MAAQAELAGAEAELEKQRALNEKLENDLLQIQTHNPTPKARANGQDTPSDDDVLAGLDLGKKVTVSTALLLPCLACLLTQRFCFQPTPSRNSPIPFASSADTSILPIVTGQRDRFRQRNAELEEVCLGYSL